MKIKNKLKKIALGITMFGLLFTLSTLVAKAVTPDVTTNPATSVSTTDATLNGTNGPTAADGHSIWVSLAPFVTSSTTLPSGVYSTPDMGAIAPNIPFSATLSSVAGLPAITPNTTYYFAAWSEVGGTWYPGDVLSFKTELLGSLSAENFGAVNYDSGLGFLKGYTAGFGVNDNNLAGAISVVVQLYSDSTLLQTNTAILPKFNADITGTQFSSPFDMFGNFAYATDGYWTNVRESEYGQTLTPTKVIATVTLANGKVVTAENDNPTGDRSIILPVVANVMTNPATGITTTDATLNGTNGPTAADGHSIWVSLAPFVTSSTTLPSGVYSTPDMGAIAPNIPFSATLSYVAGLPAITPNTTYYFAAWSEVGGTWYPGDVLNFKTATSTQCNVDGSQTITSDASTQYNSGNSIVVNSSMVNPGILPPGSWVNIPGASWIWGTNGASDVTTTPTTENFTKTFNITGTPTSASIDMSADNGYILKVNGNTVDTKIMDPANEFNYQTIHTYDISSYVNTGMNTLEVDVTNFGRSATTFMSNPGGLIYKITTNENECVTPTPPQPPVMSSCPVGTTESSSPLETVNVLANLATNTQSSNSLTNGMSYILKPSGTWINLPHNLSDAEYTSTDNWVTNADGYDISPYFLGAGEFDLQVDNAFINWGSYSPSHEYSYLYTGNGSPVNLGVFDGDSTIPAKNLSWYGDNQGSLNVDIYTCVPNNTEPSDGSISGMKYNDINRNGKKGVNEPGLEGWTINLYSDNGDETSGDTNDVLVATTTTDASGNYVFNNIAPGTYEVREVHQKGWKRISKNPEEIVIVSGSKVTDVNFGNAQKLKKEKEDTNKDDHRDDQSGKYYSNNGKSDYEKDKDKSEHQHQGDGHNLPSFHH